MSNQQNTAQTETRTQQFKRILALTGKTIAGNLIATMICSAVMLPIGYLGTKDLTQSLNFAANTSMAVLIMFHIWTGAIMAYDKDNPLYALLMTGHEFYSKFIPDEAEEKMTTKFQAIKNKIAARCARQHIKGK
ncbi:hypothetical protein HDR63_01730 [bacterium]|nr:hypothetical protein [bacterium]